MTHQASNHALDPTAVSVSVFTRFDFTESFGYGGRAVPAGGQLVRQPTKHISVNLIGAHRIEMQWHGTKHSFETFEQSQLKSLGFHFGDLDQATHFAGSDGWLFKANLSFVNLLDIGDQDWGWTSLQHIVFAFYTSCVLSRVPVDQADVQPFLGTPPWSLVALKKTSELSLDDQTRLSSLFAANKIDGIRYVNKFEPPGHAGGTAYFVLRPDQIEVIERSRAEPSSRAPPSVSVLTRLDL